MIIRIFQGKATGFSAFPAEKTVSEVSPSDTAYQILLLFCFLRFTSSVGRMGMSALAFGSTI